MPLYIGDYAVTSNKLRHSFALQETVIRQCSSKNWNVVLKEENNVFLVTQMARVNIHCHGDCGTLANSEAPSALPPHGCGATAVR